MLEWLRGSRWGTAVLIAVSGSIVACGGSGAQADAPEDDWRGALLAAPIPRIDFTLRDTDGRPYSFHDETHGFLTLLFFGYTSCPDICPVHMANLAAVLERYPADVQRRVKVVFVTTDPARDTPQVLRSWLDRFDPSFIGLWGSVEEIDSIQAALRLPVATRAEPDADGSYEVGHAATVLAFEPDGPARVAYLFGTRQADWQHDLPKLLRGGARDR